MTAVCYFEHIGKVSLATILALWTCFLREKCSSFLIDTVITCGRWGAIPKEEAQENLSRTVLASQSKMLLNMMRNQDVQFERP